MKLVAVQVNGETKFYPPAPNWDQLWGTGAYWGPTYAELHPEPPKTPVTQDAIGTTPTTPVYVAVDSGAVPGWAALLITVLVALAGAFGGQQLAHSRATKRDEEERYVDAASALFDASAGVNGAMGEYIFRYSLPGDPDARHAAFGSLARATNSFEGTAITFDLRSGDSNDPVLNHFDTAQAKLEAFLDIGRMEFDVRAVDRYHELVRLHRAFVTDMNLAIVEARKLTFGRAPGRRKTPGTRPGLSTSALDAPPPATQPASP